MIEINNTTKQKIDKKIIELIAARFLRAYKKNKAIISLAIVGATRIKQLNLQYRKINKTTDVLSFPGKGKYLGEVIINIQETKKPAKYREVFRGNGSFATLRMTKIERSASYIFYFLLVHGLLHLVGYDDKTDKERLAMLKQGEKFLNLAL